jgi:hypothetical protein
MDQKTLPLIWTDILQKITPHFTVRDALWLPKWNRLANGGDGLTFEIKSSIIETCQLAERVRTLLDDCPMNVTSFYRPKSYAALVGSTENSPHCFGLAVDFTTLPEMPIEEAKAILRPHLAWLGCRMEFGTKTWIHIDRRDPGPSGREFKV